MLIADSWNNRIQEIPVTNGVQYRQQMTKYDIYTIAGSAAGTQGNTGDGGLATSALLVRYGLASDDSAWITGQVINSESGSPPTHPVGRRHDRR